MKTTFMAFVAKIQYAFVALFMFIFAFILMMLGLTALNAVVTATMAAAKAICMLVMGALLMVLAVRQIRVAFKKVKEEKEAPLEAKPESMLIKVCLGLLACLYFAGFVYGVILTVHVFAMTWVAMAAGCAFAVGVLLYILTKMEAPVMAEAV